MSSFYKGVAGFVVVGFVFVVSPLLMASEGPAIEGATVQCILNAPFPQLNGVLAAGSEVEAARLFFKAADQANYYWVPMTRDEGQLRAVLPQPKQDTKELVYYIETVDSSGDISRSETVTAKVVQSPSQCQGDKIAGTFSGSNPNLIIGSTVGTTNAPLGFESTGVIGTVSAEGRIAAVGSKTADPGIDIGSLLGDQYAFGGGITVLSDRDAEEPASPSAP